MICFQILSMIQDTMNNFETNYNDEFSKLGQLTEEQISDGLLEDRKNTLKKALSVDFLKDILSSKQSIYF